MSDTALSDMDILNAEVPAETSAPSSAESGSDTTAAPESTGNQYEGESPQEQQTATDRESQDRQPVPSKEADEPATYEKFGSPEDFKELVEQDTKIFSHNFSDNLEWSQNFIKEHPDTYWRLWDIGTSMMARTNPEKWEQIQKGIVYNALQKDDFWQFLEGAYKAEPAARTILGQIAQYLSGRFGMGPVSQAPQAASIDPELSSAAGDELEKFFDASIEKALPQLQSVPERERAKTIRGIHGELQAALQADQQAMTAIRNAMDGTPAGVRRATIMMGEKGLSLLPQVLGKLNIQMPEAPLGVHEARGMSDKDILNSTRRADLRPAHAQRPSGKLTPGNARALTFRQILDDARPVEMQR